MENKEEHYHLEGFNWRLIIPGEPSCIDGCIATSKDGNKSLVVEIDRKILRALANLEYHVASKKSYGIFFKEQSEHNFKILKKIKNNAEEILERYNFKKDFELLSITPKLLGEDVDFVVNLIMDGDLPEYLEYKKLI